MFRRYELALFCGLFLIPGFGRAEEGFFDSKGVKIHYLVEGKGEPVFLIHGFAINAQLQWGASGIIKSLARDHRVIALDVRGHGKSDKPRDAEKYGVEMVEDVVRLLDHLKIPKAHVVGYSMGALITGKLVATHPDRVLSATLGGSGVFPEGATLPPFLEKLADSLEKGKGLGTLLKDMTPAGKSTPPTSATKILSRQLVGENGKALAAVVRGWKDLGVSDEQLKANKVPTLALVGSKDPLKETVDRIKDDMGNLKVIVIDGADHMNTYSNPKFVSNVRKFLNEHKSTPAKPSRERKKAEKKSAP